MNYVMSDNGNYVIAVGAPGSMERVRVQYPTVLEKLRCFARNHHPLETAHFFMASNGIHSKMERENLLTLAQYPEIYETGTANC